MLNLILGRAGSGKTEYIRELLAEKAESGEDGIIFIVPEQFSFESERAMLKRLGAKKARRIEILSFTRLTDSFRREYGGENAPTLDESGRIVLMSLALDNIQDKLTVYKKYVKNPKFINEMLSFSNEIKQNAVTPESFFDASLSMKNGLMKNKIAELSLILQTYDALIRQSFSDDRDELTRLYEGLCENKFFQGRITALDAFKGFTGQEMKIIGRILSQSREAYITLCTDNLNDKEGSIGVFSNVKATGNALKKMAEKANVKVAVPVLLPSGGRFENDTLKFLEENACKLLPEKYEGESKEITVCACDDISQECDYIAATVKKLIRNEDIRLRDIAVIFRNENDNTRQLNASFKKYGIPFFEDIRQPVAAQPLIALVRSALNAITSSFDTACIMRYLKTGLTCLDTERISKLENYAYIWNISGGRWLDDFTQNPDGFSEKKLNKELDEINKIRKQAVEPLLKLKNKCGGASCREISKAVYEFLIDIGADKNLKSLAVSLEKIGEKTLASEQERVWDLLMETLDRLAFATSENTVSLTDFTRLFEIIAANLDLGSIPSFLDEVIVGSADKIRISGQRVVFIAGANEGVFPQNPSGGVILTGKERKRLFADYGIRTSDSDEYTASDEKFLVYSALSAPSERLYITYSRKSESGENMSESSLVSAVKRIFPKCECLDTADMPAFYFVESERSAFEAFAALDGENPLKSALKYYFSDNGIYKERIERLESIRENKPFKIENRELSEKLFGKTMYLSASKVETYYGCPFNYFCKYGIKANERRKAELDARLNGTVVHYVLENMIRSVGSGKLCRLTSNERKEKIQSLLNEYLENFMGGKEDKTSGFLYNYNCLSEQLCLLIDHIACEFKESGFEARDFELSINKNSPEGVLPYKIELSGGGEINITGVIDRVDVLEAGEKAFVRIVDYKTGAKTFSLYEVLEGLNMQMLIYLFCLEENAKERYGDIVPAGILYKPAGAFSQSGLRNADAAKAIDKKYKSNGMLLDDSRVIGALCSSDDKTFKGKNLITLGQMGKLKLKIDDLLKQMGENLRKGEISVFPTDNACKFCLYGDVCGIEDDLERRKINKLSHAEALAVIDGGESNER